MLKYENMVKEFVEEIGAERNLSKGTKNRYRVIIRKYCQFHQMNIHELLEEADKEEEEGIRWKYRKLKTRLLSFRTYLVEEGLNISTIKNYINTLKTIYGHYDIEIHKLPLLSDKGVKKSEPLFFKDLPNHAILKKCLNMTKPVIQAWILTQSSTGLANVDIHKLQIKDYIKFTKEYHKLETNDIYEVMAELNRQLYDGVIVVPTIFNKRNKTDVYHFTFMSPECVAKINSYLLSREDELTPESKLLDVHYKTIKRHFDYFNDKLNLGRKNGRHMLTPYMLRKYQSSYIKLGDIGLDYEKANALHGRKKQGSEPAYFFDHIDDFKREYIRALPNIMINWETEKIPNSDFEDLKKQNKQLSEQMKEIDKIKKKLEGLL